MGKYNKEVNNKKCRKYRRTAKGKLALRRAVTKYEKSNPLRRIAWNLASKIKSEPCMLCGEKAHRHHPDISKPLEVIFLCPQHHKDAHRDAMFAI